MARGKPFKAVPIHAGKRYRRKAARQRHKGAAKLLGAAALAGAAIGVGSVAMTPQRIDAAATAIRPLAVSAGLMRARVPQAGDHWSQCAEARAAGSAPIYVGEPGYRDGLDGDGDGIACEPYRGM